MSTYTIITKSGATFDGLKVNGTMFVSQTEVTKDMFSPSELESVTIVEHADGHDFTEVKKEQVCDAVLHWDEGYLFNIRDKMEHEELDELKKAMRVLLGGDTE